MTFRPSLQRSRATLLITFECIAFMPLSVQLSHICILTRQIQDILGKIYICVDSWTSLNIISFLRVTTHWHEGGKIQHIILDFVKYDLALYELCFIYMMSITLTGLQACTLASILWRGLLTTLKGVALLTRCISGPPYYFPAETNSLCHFYSSSQLCVTMPRTTP